MMRHLEMSGLTLSWRRTISPVVMPGGLGTAEKAITRVRVQESQGTLATVHFMVG